MGSFIEEIAEQPAVAERLLARRDGTARKIAARIREVAPHGFVIAARGSSDHAALYAKYLFGVRNRAIVALAAPSLFTHYGSAPSFAGHCVIGISQSGASPDVIAVVEEANRQGALSIAITNQPESRLAKAAQLLLPLEAGEEWSVPASKTYTASLLALAIISQELDSDPGFGSALARVPEAVSRVLDSKSQLAPLVTPLTGPRAIVLGRGYNLATAEEIALKLMETSYLLARAWSVADFEHGPIALVEPGLPMMVVSGGGPVGGGLESIRHRLDSAGCRVLELRDDIGAVDRSISSLNLNSGLPEALTPITLAVAGQLLAHAVAVARGIDPDRPRTLNKVTRTW